jgi:hypothetical protein
MRPCGTYIAGAFALERWLRRGAAAEKDGVRVSFVEGVREGSRVVLERTKGSLVTATDWAQAEGKQTAVS